MKRKRTSAEYAAHTPSSSSGSRYSSSRSLCDTQLDVYHSRHPLDPLDLAIPSLSRSLSSGPSSPVSLYNQSPLVKTSFTSQERSYIQPQLPVPHLHQRSRSLPSLVHLRSLPTVVPLSHHNLLAMYPSQYPITPDKSATSTSSIPQITVSPSKASTASTRDPGAKLEWIQIMGEGAGQIEFGRKPGFKEAVMQIADGDRHSAMKPESAKRFQTTMDHMKTRSEATILHRLMPYLVKKDREVSATPNERRSFEEDFLDWNDNTDFKTGSVPIPANKSYEQDIDKAFGVKNPRPDYLFGFDSRAFSPDQLRLFHRFDPELSRGLISPFLAVEWKGSDGKVSDAKIQARRAGAAMVYARREARFAIALSLDSEGRGNLLLPTPTIAALPNLDPGVDANAFDTIEEKVDMNTVAFSVAVTPDFAAINVHWAQEAEDEVIWYMAVVKKCVMDMEGVSRIRAVLHNIIDWNLEFRMAALKKELAVYEHVDREEAEKARREGNPRGKRRRVI